MTPKWLGWETVKELGSGSFGKVYEIQKNVNGQITRAALKVISIPASEQELNDYYDTGMASTEQELDEYIESLITELTTEVETMFRLKGCKNIVHYDKHMIIGHDGWKGVDILIKMELLTPLNQYMQDREADDKLIISLGIDICNALSFCHSQNPVILHRDIKPGNIMVDKSGNFKLGDFGVARVLEGTKSAHTKVGTESYMAPEVLLNSRGYGVTADIYSLGMMLYRLLNKNRMPFVPTEGPVSFQAREDAKVRRLRNEPIPLPAAGSTALKQAVMKAIEFYPENRYQSAEEFGAALLRCLQNDNRKENRKQFVETTQTVKVNAPQKNQFQGDFAYNQEPKNNTSAPIQDKKPQQKKHKYLYLILAIAAADIVVAVILLILLFNPKLNVTWENYDGTVLTSQSFRKESEAQYDGETPTRAADDDYRYEFAGWDKSEDSDGNITYTAKYDAKEKGVQVGDTITFGSYEQDNDLSNGKEEIEWIVLEKDGTNILLISKYALDGQQYNTFDTDVTWESCSLRKWLNETFLNEAFSSEEIASIATTTVTADKNPSYTTSSGNDTQDQVFLLSITEVEQYFSSDSARQCEATAYAKTQGVFTSSSKGTCWWLLRSPGNDGSHVAAVNAGGRVVYPGYDVTDATDCVRPALWINLES